MKYYNSDYKKTLFYHPLSENNIVVADLKYPGSLIDYIENLIWDLIKKRNLIDKRIVFYTDSLWMKQSFLELLILRGIIDKQYNIKDSTNQISIVSLSEDFDEIIQKSIGGDANDRICECDSIILIDFGVIVKEYYDLIEKLRKHLIESLWIGIEISTKKDCISYPSIEKELIEYLPSCPETFEGFANRDVLNGINQILRSIEHNDDVGVFSKQFNQEIFNNNSECTLEIGTEEYINNESEEEDCEANEFSKPFNVSIKISTYRLEFSIKLEDYNIEGSAYLNYEMDFENEISEDGDIECIKEMIDELCERIYSERVNIRLS